MDADSATDLNTETFIGPSRDLCRTLICITFCAFFSPFFLAAGKAYVIQPCLRSAKSRRAKQSSGHWSEKMLLSATKVLMITALLPSDIQQWCWMMQGKREGNAQPSVCINTTKNVHNSVMCQSHAHTKLLPDAITHAVSVQMGSCPYSFPPPQTPKLLYMDDCLTKCGITVEWKWICEN